MKKGSKRVERPGLSSEEVDEIKQAFDLFDTMEPVKSILKNSKQLCNHLDLIAKTQQYINL